MKIITKTKQLTFDKYNWSLITEKKILGLPVKQSICTKDYEKNRYLFGLYESSRFSTLEKITSVTFQKKVLTFEINKNRQDQISYFTRNSTIDNCIVDYKSWLLAAKLHDKIFSKYKSIYSNKIVYLIATGPSLNEFVPPEKNDDIIYVGVNKAVNFNKIKLHYLFVKDYNNFDWFRDIRNYGRNECRKFFGITANNMLNCSIPAYALTDIDNYFIVKDYHDEGFPNDISFEPFADFGSTVFSALQFILYTTPKEIRLVGCDCSSGYFSGANQKKQSVQHSGLLLPWLKFRDYAYFVYPFIKITSINPVGLKGVFNDCFQTKNDNS